MIFSRMSKKSFIHSQRLNPTLSSYFYFNAHTNLSVLTSLLRESSLPISSVLDLGCGTKPFACLPFFNGSIYIGIDHSTNSCADYHVNLCADKGQLPSFENKFDLCIISEFLEHSSDPFNILDYAVANLVDHGHIFISSPFLFQEHGKPYDYFRFTKYFYHYVAEKYSLDLVELVPSNSILSTIPLLILQLLQTFCPLFLLQILSLFINLPIYLVEKLLLFFDSPKRFPFLYIAPLGYAANFKKN